MPDYKRLIKGKLRSRKTNQESFRPKKSYRAIIFLLIPATLVLSAFFWMHSFLLHFSGFKISKTSIIDADGKALENPESIFRLEEKVNLFKFDMKRIARDIQARHPELISLRMRKEFPNALLIVAGKRKPVLIVGTQNFYLADEEGFILPFESRYGHLPKVVGIQPRQTQVYTKTHSLRLRKAIGLLEELKLAGVYPEYKISRIDIQQYSAVAFYFKNGIEVKMGEGGFARKAALLKGVLAQLREEDTIPKYIDMRFDSPVVKP